jgi:hypothetical protein
MPEQPPDVVVEIPCEPVLQAGQEIFPMPPCPKCRFSRGKWALASEGKIRCACGVVLKVVRQAPSPH